MNDMLATSGSLGGFVSEIAEFRGLLLPLDRWEPARPESLRIILNHGLGARDPSNTGHGSDNWIRLIGESALESGLAPVLYTARGHKGSSGWEASAVAGDLEQFTWERLGGDMFSLAREHLGLDSFVVGGSSMGSATALYCVMNNPEQFFRGLILIRPPTAWETRRARKKVLQSSAKKCHQRNVEQSEEKGGECSVSHLVLLGTSESDLPSPTDSVDTTYGRVRCPTLILAIEGDETHPLETATTLNALIAGSVLHVAKDFQEASASWPKIVREFTAALAPPL